MLLGDSSAVTVGVSARHETVGAYLAERLASRTGFAVELEVLARAGATTAGLDRQVRSVIGRPTPGVAFILIGGNDVMLPAPVRRSAVRLGGYVCALRGAGWEVVVGSCPDIGAAPALRSGVGALASLRSRRLARLQSAAVLAAGGRVFSLATDAFRERPGELYCPDGFHPSADGYRVYFRLSDATLTDAGEAWSRRRGTSASGSVAAVGAAAPGQTGLAAGPAPQDGPVVVRPRLRDLARTRLSGDASRRPAGQREPA
ncbi:SGNH/GDSL hydrolase family protein [Streptomyces cinereoruber]|uniref:SGNH/GDSL hydrolase family protein n=1 Tax=Streptomyces cinereoruber TaxID=67260 RepID=UPI003635E24B